jgi:predicted Zn-dependent peptidase
MYHSSKAVTKPQIRTIVSSARDIFPAAPKSEGAPKDFNLKIEKTVLDGGVKVISVNTPHTTNTLSLFVKAGSRYETRLTQSSAYVLKRLAFKGTAEKSAIRMVRDLEHIGSSFSSHVSRDHISYHIRGLRLTEKQDVNLAIQCESLRYLLNPLLLEYELEGVKTILEDDVVKAQDPKIKAIEHAHFEAFRDSGLGQPLYPMAHAVSEITTQKLHRHITNTFYPGERILIVATGVEHDVLISKLKPLFTNPSLKGKFSELQGLKPLPVETPTPQNSTYHGHNSVRLPGGGDSHIAIAFPGFAITHKSKIALSVLGHIIGRGSQELEGPGDSQRNSRLYEAVSKNNFIKSAETFNLGYSDAGLFGVYSVSNEGTASNHFSVIYNLITGVSKNISDSELQVARKALKTKFLRKFASDDFILAAYVAKTEKEPSQLLSEIDAVQLEDVKKLASDLATVKPVVVAVGDVFGVPKL